jgi:hypothetical protein
LSEQPPVTTGPPSAAPAPAPAAPAKRRGVSAGAVIVLVIGLVAMLAVGWYAQEIKAYYKLQIWNKKAPLVPIEAFGKALQANDATALEAVSPGIAIEQANGVISTIKPPHAPAQMPPREAKTCMPKLPANATAYRFVPVQETEYVTVDGETGPVEFAVGLAGGKLVVTGFSARAPQK